MLHLKSEEEEENDDTEELEILDKTTQFTNIDLDDKKKNELKIMLQNLSIRRYNLII